MALLLLFRAGSVLTQTPADTADGTDAAVLVVGLVVADSASVLDAGQLLSIEEFPTSSAWATDLPLVEQGPGAGDTGDATDAATAAQGLDRLVGDPAGLTDDAAATQSQVFDYDDEIPCSDDADFVQAQELEIDDAPLVLDEALLDSTWAVADAAGAADAASTELTSDQNLADSAGATDAAYAEQGDTVPTNLPVNIDATYADSGADASVKLHQQHHDIAHNVVNLLSANTYFVKDYGALGNGSTDDTAAIAACLAAAPAGSTVFFSAGTYIVSGANNMFTLDKANITLRGVGVDSSVIKVKNSNGDFIRIFVSGGAGPAGLHVHDLTFNGNFSNNPLSSVATLMATKYRFTFDIDNAHGAIFERVRFTDMDCVGALLFGDSDNVNIRNCVFDAIGDGAYHDHSCINVRGHGTRILNNRFTGIGPSAWTAVEMHGSDVTVKDNRCIDFARFGIVSGDTVNGYKNIWSHNEVIGCGDGIEIWAYDITGGTPTAPSVRDVVVEGNVIDINYDPWATDMDRAEGINLQVGSTSCVERVKIINNEITYRTVTVATTASTHTDSCGICFVRGASIVLTGSGPADTDVDIRGNTIKGSISAGINVEGWYPLWRLRISDNTITDPGSGSVNSFYFKGITIWQPSARGFALTDAVVSNNLILDTRGTGKITGGVDTANVGYGLTTYGNRQFNNFARRHDGTAVTAFVGNGGAAWGTS